MLCNSKMRRPECKDCPVVHMSICSHLDRAAIEEFRALAARRCYPAGAIVFDQGEALARLAREAMIEVSSHGHPDAAGVQQTPALDAGQIAEIVDYIRDALMLPAPLADASVGRRIYARTCSVCHGERGNSASWAKNSLNPAPVDSTSDKARQELGRQRMLRSVRYGVRDTAMMPFATQLSREEIAAVVDYVRANFVKLDQIAATGAQAAMAGRGTAQHSLGTGYGHDHAAAGAVFDPDTGFAVGLIGDYAEGEIFYKKNCAECHGLGGDGNGRRAYFMRRKPQDFTAPKTRAELNRPHLFEGIAKGVVRTEMSAWSKVLDAQQIANVAEYVFRAFIRPTAAEPTSATATPIWKPPTDTGRVKKSRDLRGARSGAQGSGSPNL